MPSFKPKSEEALAWDLVKFAVRSKVNLEVAEYRNRRVNEMLGELWPAFQAALSGEVLLEIEPEMETWVRDSIGAIDAPSRV